MIFSFTLARWRIAALLGGLIVSARAQTPAAMPAVELPPMMVEESTSSTPWLYVDAGETEFLSRCSSTNTSEIVEAWLTRLQLVRALLPENLVARMEVPAIFVLYAQDLNQTVSPEIQRELQRDNTVPGDLTRRIDIATSMRLADRDMHASIAYIDESLFNAAGLSVAPSHVRYMLKTRVPDLPGWFIEGIERMWRNADFVLEPITLHPLIWHNPLESDALASDPTRPRALVPASELFASEAKRAVENRHARHAEVRAATQELFVRWAIATGGPTREALWKFAARAAEEPVTDSLCEEVFGFGFSELRDRLSDYLPKAVEETVRLPVGKLPPLPPFKVERATSNQIARIRGEWERLAIGHVQRRLPQVREPYIAQARRTLRRAYDAGDRDPRLLATMGLCEIDAANEAAAREFLDPAVAASVVRPRAYYELARLRFNALPRAKPLSFTELAPVLDPLRRSLTQSPPLAESYRLLGEAWTRCETAPNTEELAELRQGARLFARQPEVTYALAQAFARHGKKTEAAAALAQSGDCLIDKETAVGIERLRAEIDRPRQ